MRLSSAGVGAGGGCWLLVPLPENKLVLPNFKVIHYGKLNQLAACRLDELVGGRSLVILTLGVIAGYGYFQVMFATGHIPGVYAMYPALG